MKNNTPLFGCFLCVVSAVLVSAGCAVVVITMWILS